jgi:hypothetical protein
MQSSDLAPSDAMKSLATPSDTGAKSSVDTTNPFEAATSSDVAAVMLKRRPAAAATLKYLEDK